MKKVLISAIVIMSFLTYAVSTRGKESTAIIAPKSIQAKISPLPTASPTAVPPTPLPTAVHVLQPTTKQELPTPTSVPVVPTATPKPSSTYKDGTYNGSVAD